MATHPMIAYLTSPDSEGVSREDIRPIDAHTVEAAMRGFDPARHTGFYFFVTADGRDGKFMVSVRYLVGDMATSRGPEDLLVDASTGKLVTTEVYLVKYLYATPPATPDIRVLTSERNVAEAMLTLPGDAFGFQFYVITNNRKTRFSYPHYVDATIVQPEDLKVSKESRAVIIQNMEDGEFDELVLCRDGKTFYYRLPDDMFVDSQTNTAAGSPAS